MQTSRPSTPGSVFQVSSCRSSCKSAEEDSWQISNLERAIFRELRGRLSPGVSRVMRAYVQRHVTMLE